VTNPTAQTREALVEVIRETMWRQTFAPHEDPMVIERQKANWPDDWARTLPKAEGILAALEAAGVRLVPDTPSETQLIAARLTERDDIELTREEWTDAYKSFVAASPYAKEPTND
jgi:hypothetical protein